MPGSADPDRYSKRPFLRFLDCYVLAAIGQLDDAQEEALKRMEPKLSELLGLRGTWLQIVEAQMEYPASFPSHIRSVWSQYLERARSVGASVCPNEFVVEFGREYFPDPDTTARGKH